VAAEAEVRFQAAAANSLDEGQEALTVKILHEAQLATIVQRPGQLPWAKNDFFAHISSSVTRILSGKTNLLPANSKIAPGSSVEGRSCLGSGVWSFVCSPITH
jgi:hypothetical protein